jgi:acyl transferase domain-containing protein/3-hydroxymyristoyl/3-hydroxydecanoyl-(acyl carrier protein) dehydratase
MNIPDDRIAIVGTGCVLPGALGTAQLDDLVRRKLTALRQGTEADFGLSPDQFVTAQPDTCRRPHAWTAMGGFVQGCPALCAQDTAATALHDKGFAWVLAAAREALADVALPDAERRALILGNISYPTKGMADYVSNWTLDSLLGREPVSGHAPDRFMSAGPAQLAARQLGFEGGAFSLDAACASGLYAIGLGCESLREHRADIVLAGGLNASDFLWLQIGFSALGAMSRSGQSRPFHAGADGLIPGQGCAVVTLKRLADAQAAGDPVLAVLRGHAFTNDGSAGAFLAPDSAAQNLCMATALTRSDADPADVGYVECHATGTQVGDAAELTALAANYPAATRLGSLKGNIGHTLGAAGAAGLIKMIGALRDGVYPATAGTRPLRIDVAEHGFDVPDSPQDWGAGPRIAAVSAFGFGGNNAHLIVEAAPKVAGHKRPVLAATPFKPSALAVIGFEVWTDTAADTATYVRQITGRAQTGNTTSDTLDLARDEIRFPPNQMVRTLPQQTVIACLADRLLKAAPHLDRPQTGVFVGMSTDVRVCDSHLAMRLEDMLTDRALPTTGAFHDGLFDALAPINDADGVLGAMPNMPANRINVQEDLRGPGFTISQEDGSGLVALEIAAHRLRRGEVTAAVVGAVDFCRNDVHEAALAAVCPDAPAIGADAAVVLLLKTPAQAKADGDTVLTLITPCDLDAGPRHPLAKTTGHAHAASGLLDVVAGIIRTQAGMDAALNPFAPLPPEGYPVTAGGLMSPARSYRITPVTPAAADPDARMLCFAGDTLADMRSRLESNTPGGTGPVRLAIVGTTPAQLKARRKTARTYLQEAAPPTSGRITFGVFARSAPLVGEVVFTFTGGAGLYPEVGEHLAGSFPNLLPSLRQRLVGTDAALAKLSDLSVPEVYLNGVSTTLVALLHTQFVQGVLGLAPDAALGLCLGETIALQALGLWQDVSPPESELGPDGLYLHALGGDYAVIQRALGSDDPICWRDIAVLGTPEDVLGAIGDEQGVFLSIIMGPQECYVAGISDAVERVIERLKPLEIIDLPESIALHTPLIESYADKWRAMHTRPISSQPKARIYSCAFGKAYEPTEALIAEALTRQAIELVDLRPAVQAAYADGARVFVSHGPSTYIARNVDNILGDAPHLAVSLDLQGTAGDVQAALAAAELWVAGLNPDLSVFAPRAVPPEPMLRLPLRRSLPVLADIDIAAKAGPTEDQSAPMVSIPAAPQKAAAAPPPLPLPEVAMPQNPPPHFQPPVAPPPVPYAPSHTDLVRIHMAFLDAMAAGTQAHGGFLALARGAAPTAQCLAPSTPPLPRVITAAPQLPTPPVSPPPAPIAPTQPDNATRPGHPSAQAKRVNWDRADLIKLASGRVSEVYGPEFAAYDAHDLLVRMPAPPLLLCDRITAIEGAPGSMGRGRIWTETDVVDDAWYLHAGHMLPGVLIECGQADLTLISWLGADFHNKGERAYRLLGCELEFHSALPKPGDLLQYEIRITGHAKHGDVRLFFFEYDGLVNGKPMITVRNGQAGFFTKAELEASEGVLFSAGDVELLHEDQVDPCLARPAADTLSLDDLAHISDGDVARVMGPDFDLTRCHTRTPSIPGGDLNILGAVTALDVLGGPGGRGYLRSERQITPDDWFFDGHFHNDPCMPGTLMADGCVQAMALLMIASGQTLDHDGWRFEPAHDVQRKFVCRGEVTPQSKLLVTEVFVQQRINGPVPMLEATVLCTADGLPAFLCERLRIQLVPDWPQHVAADRPIAASDTVPTAHIGNFPCDELSILNCAIGPPDAAFGPSFAKYLGPIRSPRLPAPPYLFMSRVETIDTALGKPEAGARITASYDLTPDEWYFEASTNGTMPFCVLLEAALQPCGWLATYGLDAGDPPAPLVFRNLDGTGRIYRDVTRKDQRLSVDTTLTSVSKLGETRICVFDVQLRSGPDVIFDLQTVFGFFPPDVMADQKGTGATDTEKARIAAPLIDPIQTAPLAGQPMIQGTLMCWPQNQLLMVDRVAIADGSGTFGARGQKDVDAGEWFFKAHFFQDPVQPGSIGLEALLQLMLWRAVQAGAAEGITDPQVTSIGYDQPIEWHFRGQVTPEKSVIDLVVDITTINKSPARNRVAGTGALWVDGLKIYTFDKLSFDIMQGDPT